MSQTIMVKNGKRIDWIDIAKGMSIILIVFGHSFLAKIPYIGDWFSSFLIPFFFFMSGLLHKTTIDFQKFIHNRWNGLLRPFFIFSIIVLIGYFGLGFEEGMHRVSTLTYGWGGYALWFIPVLLATNLLYFLICRLLQSSYSRIMVVSILCIFGYLTYRLSLPNYWNLNFTFTAVFFYGIGNICQPILNKIFSGSLVKCILLTTFSLLLSCLFIFNDKPEFFVNHLGGGHLTLVVGLSGAILMCCLALLLSKISHPLVSRIKFGFKYFGKNSYIVLAFHQIIILLFISLLPNVPKIIMHISMWIILVILIELITRKFPFILGREIHHSNKEIGCVCTK